MYKCILASGSPRRKEILRQGGICFEVIESKKEEKAKSIKPELVAKELSLLKAEDIFRKYAKEDCIVIGADTIVAIDDKILGKPKDEKDAFAMIKMLQGRTHTVYTGVAVFILEGRETKFINFVQASKVQISSMSDEMIYEYIQTGEPFDKAGAYGIQGSFALYVEGIEGDYYNIVGLPVNRLYHEILEYGIDLKNDCWNEDIP